MRSAVMDISICSHEEGKMHTVLFAVNNRFNRLFVYTQDSLFATL